jgi:hypothetical protein
MVAFGIGGLPDIIDHKINGYLARLFDTLDFAQGIDWVLNNESYGELSKNAREKVVREFDYDIVAKKYIRVVRKLQFPNNSNIKIEKYRSLVRYFARLVRRTEGTKTNRILEQVY